MLYRLINYPLIVALCALGVFVLRKIKTKRKKVISVFSVLWCVLIVALISVFPIENIFVTFDSPEKVVSYTKSLKTIEVIEGKESCVAISKTDASSYTYTFVLKEGSGYKIAYYFSVQQLERIHDSHGSFTVYKVRGTQDYYISCFTADSISELEVYDENDRRIDCETYEIINIMSWIYLNDYSDGCYIMLNGEKIELTK
jgi:hypothetical protein